MSYINMRDEWKLFIGWLAIVILLLLSGCASVKPNEQWSDESITLATTVTGLSMMNKTELKDLLPKWWSILFWICIGLVFFC